MDCRYLSYFFINGTEDVAGTEEHEAVRRAFDSWSAETNLDFIEACNEDDADIRILWGVENHGDASPFDNGGTIFSNVLAHAFFPPPNAGVLAGDLHFEDFEDWRINGTDIDVESVALHELGHSLGLRHSDVNNSVMEATYEGERRDLTQDDIDGIRAIYGNRTYPLQGPSTFCSNTATYTLDDADCLNPNLTITWEVSGGLSLISGQGTGTIVVQDNSTLNPKGSIRVTIDSGCDELSYALDVCAGKPGLPTINPDGLPTITMCLGEILSVYMHDTNCGQGNSIEWWSTGSLTEMFNCTGRSCVFEATSYGIGNFYVRTKNRCGSSPTMGGTVNVKIDCKGDGPIRPQFRVSPNPTNGAVEVLMPTEYYARDIPKTIRITDDQSNMIYEEVTYDNWLQFNIDSQKAGFYYISVIYEQSISTQKLLKL